MMGKNTISIIDGYIYSELSLNDLKNLSIFECADAYYLIILAED